MAFKFSPYRYKFKARELDPRILEGGPILPKKPPVKPPTQPIGFDLEIEKRIQERESKKKSEDEHFEFHSRPCPTKILEDVVVRMVEALHADKIVLLMTTYPPTYTYLNIYYDQGIILGVVGDKETYQRWILFSGKFKSNKGDNICLSNIRRDRSVQREMAVRRIIGIQRR